MSTSEEIERRRAELAGMDVPFHLLRTLRLTELHLERAVLNAQRCDLHLGSHARAKELLAQAEEHFSALVTGCEVTCDLAEVVAEAESLEAVRDLQLHPVELRLEALMAEVEVLEDTTFVGAYDSEELGRDVDGAIDAFFAAHPEHGAGRRLQDARAALS